MKPEPPAYLKYIPAVFIAAAAAALFVVYSLVAGFDLGRAAGGYSAAWLIEEARKVADEILKEVEQAGGILPGDSVEKEREKRRRLDSKLAREKQKQSKPVRGPLSQKPRLMVDFSGPAPGSMLTLKKSPAAKAFFRIDRSEGGKKTMSARLGVDDIGPAGQGERFATGIVRLSGPFSADSVNGIEAVVRGDNLSSFNMAVFTARGEGSIGWSVTGLKAGKEWAAVTIPITDFEMWHYNVSGPGYVYPDKWSYPERIESVSFYLRPENFSDRKSGALWIESVSVR